jgi:dTDP-glucose pyrophosphorylase/CBS domain-containing protein
MNPPAGDGPIDDVVAGLASTKGPRTDVAAFSMPSDATVREAMACINRSARLGIGLVVDDDGRFLNTLSDGDVRRGLLRGVSLEDPIATLLAIKTDTPHPLPVSASDTTDRATLLDIMRGRAVRQVPLLAPDGRVTSVVTLNDLIPDEPRSLQAVVMAGGFGTRLRPLTEHTPKPMLPIAGRPLMEHIIGQLRNTGVRKINIATHFQAEKIVDHFGDGRNFGVDIAYVREEQPLGSGGALGLMQRPSDPVLVINGDVLTDVDFRQMFLFHQEHRAVLTVAVRQYEVQVPYGVIDCDGPLVTNLREKPQLTFLVNAGIYLLEPHVYDYISANEHMHMTDLVERLLAKHETVARFPVREYWLDIGQHADYERAQTDAASGKVTWAGKTE